MKRLKWGMLACILVTMVATIFATQLMVRMSRAASPQACGSWSIAPSPNNGTNSNYLYSAAAISTSDVWAAGYYANSSGGVNKTLTQHWNGTSWKVVLSANVGAGPNGFYSVAAASASEIWAVGYFTGTRSTNRPLTEEYTGTKWKVVKNPGVGSGANTLYGVSVSTANSIWAVGDYTNKSGVNQTLVEQWNGTSWSVVKSPNVGTGNNVLYSVVAISNTNIWAVGDYTNSSNVNQTLIEQWNGAKWSVIASPNNGTGANVLSSVAASNNVNVWAVGTYTNSSNVNQTLIEQWSGTSWNIVTSPNVGTGANSLSGVTVASSSNVWAVGDYNNGSVNQTLTEQWNGASWSVVTSPNNGTGANALLGVTHIPATNIWAVGDYTNSSNVNQTLTMFYC